ncbi:hypothetical protein ACQPZA_02415 [Pseudonocardia xinjiangensis]
MRPTLVLSLCVAALVIAIGVMLLVVSSLVTGAVVVLGGGAWLWWCLRQI